MSFRDLHYADEPLLLPNAWDVPSALALLAVWFRGDRHDELRRRIQPLAGPTATGRPRRRISAWPSPPADH